MGKLIRDKIPELMKAEGKNPPIHRASDEEYYGRLKEKLQEEVNEFLVSGEKEEIADILEVIDAICVFQKVEKKEIEKIQREKAEKKGKFKNRVILEQ